MKTRLHSQDIAEMCVESHYPAKLFTTGDPVKTRAYQAQSKHGLAQYEELLLDGLIVGFGAFDFSRDVEITFEHDFETVEMHFNLSGYSQGQEQGTNHPYHFAPNQHNLIYADQFKGRVDWASRQPCQIFEVNMMPHFFKPYLLTDGPVADWLYSLFENRQNGCFLPHNLPITPKMMAIIHEIRSCNRTGIFKKMLLEAKVLELLMLQLEQASTMGLSTTPKIDKPTRERMEAVKNRLVENLDQPYTLADLASYVGTNAFYLKRDFKHVFGKTVFSYWHEAKMEEAKKLLLDTQLPIGQVSERVGYKNPHHFTVAFKRKFGLLPSHLKAKKQRY